MIRYVRLAWICTASIALAFAGCSDDDDDDDGRTGGVGGTGGTAGAAGTGGSGGTAGTAGTGGAGGTAGTAGTGGAGGTAGTAGMGGTAGQGGTAGTAGTAGQGGMGGATMPAETVDCATVTPALDVAVELPNFDPADPTISVGDVIRWENTGTVLHTSTSGTPGAPDGTWDTGDLQPGDAVCVQYNEAGTWDFYCEYHLATMTGTLTVQ